MTARGLLPSRQELAVRGAPVRRPGEGDVAHRDRCLLGTQGQRFEGRRLRIDGRTRRCNVGLELGVEIGEFLLQCFKAVLGAGDILGFLASATDAARRRRGAADGAGPQGLATEEGAQHRAPSDTAACIFC